MLGMTAMKNELDRSLRVLRRSRLMRHAEFKHMIDMIDRYRHDSGLAGLVRKDHQQLEQLSQDGQFFRILARMLTEVTTTKGTMKQRDDLKKVYKWYMANRSGLHCLPRFGQSMRQMDSQTVLRFAPDVIAHYSSPRRPKKKERNENVVKKEDVETAIQKVPEEKTESEKEKEILNESPTPQLTRTTGLKRPMTAPPTLSSRKTSFGQMKGENFVESSFAGQFVTKNMVLKQKRPASAAGVIRMSTPDVSPYSHEQFVDIKTKLKQGKSPRPDTASSIASSVSIRMSSVDEIPLRSPKRPPVIPKGMTVAQVINPTAQITFEDDNYDATGSNPDSRSSSPVKMLHISVPTDDAKDTSSGAKSPSKDQKSANLKAWEEYKQKQSYGQDFIGRLKFYGRSGTPHGIRYSSHEDADRPELYTEDIIANYAELSEESFSKATDEDNDRITYHSLENFYKETEKYCMDPSQKTQIAPVRVHSRSSVSSEPLTVYVPEELAQDVRIKYEDTRPRSATEEQRKHPNVKFDAIVGLTDMVKETMEYDKEKLSPDPKFGHHQPAIAVSRRPSTAPDRVMSTPVPPNSDRPSSASSIASSESSSRNQRGEPVVLLPDKTDYTMHMRKEVQSPKEANLGHYISVSGKVKPDTTRYRRPDSARKTLRTAGSMSGNIRPATSMQTPRERWNADKESDQNERINQAASHVTTEVDSEAVARMVLINHLGSEQTRRSRGRMGIHRIGGSVPLDAELPKLPQTLQFVSFTGPARIQVKGQPDTGRLPEAPPQSPKENNSDADSVSSSRDISLDSRMMSGRSSPAFNLDETPRFEDTPRTEVQDGKVTPIAEFRLKGQAILPTNVKGQQVGDLRYSGPRSAVGNRNIDTPSDAKTIDENIQIVWDTNNAETTRDMENEREEENVGESASEEVNQVQHDEHVDGKNDEHSNDVTDETKDKDDTTDDIDSEKAKRQDNKDEVPCETTGEKPEPCDGTNGVDIEKSATQVTDGHGRGELSENQGDKDDTIAEKHKGQETNGDMLATQGAKDNITEKQETGGEGSGTQDGTDDTVAEQQKEQEEDEQEKVKEGQENENVEVNNSEKDVQPTDNDDKAESMREQQKDNVECESSNTEQENNKETVENQKETVEGNATTPTTNFVNQDEDDADMVSIATADVVQTGYNLPECKTEQLDLNKMVAITTDDNDNQDPHVSHVVMETVSDDKNDLGIFDDDDDDDDDDDEMEEMLYMSDGSRPIQDDTGSTNSSRCSSPRSTLSERFTTSTTANTQRNTPPASRLYLQYSPIHVPIKPALRSTPNSQPTSAAIKPIRPATAHPTIHPNPSDQKVVRPSSAHKPLRPVSASPQSGHKSLRPVSAGPNSDHKSLRPVSASASIGRRSAISKNQSLANASPSSSRASSASSQRTPQWKGRPLPMYGAPRDKDKETELCQRQKEAKARVNIQKIFRHEVSGQCLDELERTEREKKEEMKQAAIIMQRSYRRHLARRRAIKHRQDFSTKIWQRDYISVKAQKERERQEKMEEALKQQALLNKKAVMRLNRIGPHVDIWELFHCEERKITKAMMKRATLTIQKFCRGWIFRRMFRQVKEKALQHAPSLKEFIDLYHRMLKRIMVRHKKRNPTITLDLYEMAEFMDRKRMYESKFDQLAYPGDDLEKHELGAYFRECGLFPAEREYLDYLRMVIKKNPDKPGMRFKRDDVIEATFTIYIPKATKIKMEDFRKSTWMNPLVDGMEAKKYMLSDEVQEATLAKAAEVVCSSIKLRKERAEAERAEAEAKRLKEEQNLTATGPQGDR